jgi:hypothetical protein
MAMRIPKSGGSRQANSLTRSHCSGALMKTKASNQRVRRRTSKAPAHRRTGGLVRRALNYFGSDRTFLDTVRMASMYSAVL